MKKFLFFVILGLWVPIYQLAGAQEIAYDDGVAEESLASAFAGGELAVKFTPPSYPFSLNYVGFYLSSSGVPTATFGVMVYLADGPEGSPGTKLLSAIQPATASRGNSWVIVDLSAEGMEIKKGESFFVSMVWFSDPGPDGNSAQRIGLDTTAPDGRSWIRGPEGDWSNNLPTQGDLMIRASSEALAAPAVDLTMPKTELSAGDPLIVDFSLSAGGYSANIDIYFALEWAENPTLFLGPDLIFVPNPVPVASNIPALDIAVRVFGPPPSPSIPSVFGEFIIPSGISGSFAWVAGIIDSKTQKILSLDRVPFNVK